MELQQSPRQIKALRMSTLPAKTGVSRSQIYRLIERGEFPQGTRLSERIVVWDEAAIDAWLAEKFGK